VLALAAERGELAQPIVAGLPDLLAEVALAARREQARSIGDVLLRRTRLGLLAARELTGAEAERGLPGASGEADSGRPGESSEADGGRPGESCGDAAAPVRRVGDVMARELGWSPERLSLELSHFAEEASAEGIVAELERAHGVDAGGAPPPAVMP
jgi:glycerol-3-phosphate dehydrogenase